MVFCKKKERKKERNCFDKTPLFDRLAYLIGESLHERPHAFLEDTLYYL